MENEPLDFVVQLITALAESAIDAIIREPAKAESHSKAAFEAMWRVLAGTDASILSV